MTLAQLNALEEARFIALLGAVLEQSRRIARRAWKQRPFASVDGLFQALADEIRRAGVNEQLALVRAHPGITGKQAGSGKISAGKSSEKDRLGFLSLDRSHFERLAELNRRYRQRFGFACIVDLARHASRASVMAEMRRRLGNQADAERANALEQLLHIARGRLDRVISGP